MSASRRKIQATWHWIRATALAMRLHWPRRSRVDLRPQSNDSLGDAGEKLAGRYLAKLGYRILERGHLQRLGEIDLIAVDGKCLVFVEVKTWRTKKDFEDPAAAVTHVKQRKLTRAALTYLKQNDCLECLTRFDVVSIVWDGSEEDEPIIRHIKHAFEAAAGNSFFG